MKSGLHILMILILIAVTSVSCGGSLEEQIEEDNPAGMQQERDLAPTATPTVLSLAANVNTETPIPPLPAGYFELHIRTVVQTEQECVLEYPFTTRIEDGRMLLQGQDTVELDCRFEGEFCGEDGCIDIHLEYLMDTRVDGEILDILSEPVPSLHAFYFYDGEMNVYYSGFPPEAINPLPKENPMTIPLSDIATLVMPLEDGASASFPVGIGIDQTLDIEAPTWELILKLD